MPTETTVPQPLTQAERDEYASACSLPTQKEILLGILEALARWTLAALAVLGAWVCLSRLLDLLTA